MKTKGGKFQNSKGLSSRQRKVMLDGLFRAHMPGRLERYILKTDSIHSRAFLSYTGLVLRGRIPVHAPTWLKLLSACRKERHRKLVPVAVTLWAIYIFISIYY